MWEDTVLGCERRCIRNICLPLPPALLSFHHPLWEVDSGDPIRCDILVGKETTRKGSTGVIIDSLFFSASLFSLCPLLSFSLRLEHCHPVKVGLCPAGPKQVPPSQASGEHLIMLHHIYQRAPHAALGTSPTDEKTLPSSPICHHAL